MNTAIVRGRAKINWVLDVLAKRTDGYHELDGVMHCIELFDEVCVQRISGSGIHVYGLPKEIDPKDNLAYRAADMYLKDAGIDCGIAINIEKKIPLQSGMGGGSADAAAVLKGMDAIFRGRLEAKLIDIAAKLGADVPFCITGGAARARGIGDRLTPIITFKRMNIVIAKPTGGVSTTRAFELLDKWYTSKRLDVESAIAALSGGNYELLASSMGNVLQEVSEQLCPEIAHISKRLIQEGALSACMTGSGSGVIGLFDNANTAEGAYYRIKEIADWSAITTSSPFGATIERLI